MAALRGSQIQSRKRVGFFFCENVWNGPCKVLTNIALLGSSDSDKFRFKAKKQKQKGRRRKAMLRVWVKGLFLGGLKRRVPLHCVIASW